MPEIAEVETVRRQLAGVVRAADADGGPGLRVASVAVSHPRAVRRQPAADFVAAQAGARFGVPGRRGKYLLVPLDGTDATLVVHLRMSGQVVLVPPAPPPADHVHVVWRFTDGRQLRFRDPRTFGECFLADPGGLAELHAGLGVDALDPRLDAGLLAAAFAHRRAPVKAVLLDQRVVAGLGNIYADEVCAAAGVRPDRAAGTLSRQDVARLADAVHDVVGLAVAARGTALADAGYVDLFGRLGGFASHLTVHARATCDRCGGRLDRVKVAGRTTYACPACQR